VKARYSISSATTGVTLCTGPLLAFVLIRSRTSGTREPAAAVTRSRLVATSKLARELGAVGADDAEVLADGVLVPALESQVVMPGGTWMPCGPCSGSWPGSAGRKQRQGLPHPVRGDGARPRTRQEAQRSETYPTHDAADARRREIEAERARTGLVTGRDARLEPFAVYAAACWTSARIADTDVLPEFGARPVGSITPAMARAFRAGLVDRGLARGTIKHAFDVFRRVLGLAARDGVLPSNPAATLPRLRAGDTAKFEPHPYRAPSIHSSFSNAARSGGRSADTARACCRRAMPGAVPSGLVDHNAALLPSSPCVDVRPVTHR
jgi:hypothetical protein